MSGEGGTHACAPCLQTRPGLPPSQPVRVNGLVDAMCTDTWVDHAAARACRRPAVGCTCAAAATAAACARPLPVCAVVLQDLVSPSSNGTAAALAAPHRASFRAAAAARRPAARRSLVVSAALLKR